MDPLSAVLITITLATALKDIVETAKAIQDSFSKLPRNFRHARNLAEEVLTTLEEMREIYDDNTNVFERAKHLKKAINNLRMQMKTVHEQCVRLMPPVSDKKRDKIIIAFYIFRNRERMETLISELKNHVDRCSQQFLVLSNLRTESLIVEIHDTLLSETRKIPNSHLINFLPSTSPMTRIADSIPLHDLSKAYLHREVGVVDRHLRSLLLHWPQKIMSPEFQVPPLTISWFLDRAPLPNTMVHQQTITLAFIIQSLLKSDPGSSWIHYVDISINKLSLNLQELQMYDDAVEISTLRVNLWKMINAQYPRSNASSYRLAESLTKLSIISDSLEDQRQTSMRSTDAINIITSLSDARISNVELLARNMVYASANEQDPGRALDLATHALGVLRSGYDALAFNNLPALPLSSLSCLADTLDVKETSTWNLSSSRILSHENQFTFVVCIGHIAGIHQKYHKDFEANLLAKEALVILKRLREIYPDSRVILNELTRAYELLLKSRSMRKLNSISENLEYTDANTSIIRQLARINPQRYVLRLMNALWVQREIFLGEGRIQEAQKAYQDMSSLKELAAAPDHVDLHIPSEIEGDYYLQVARLHLLAKRPADAIYTAQNAVTQYAALEFTDPGRNPTKHVSALALLSKSLIAAEQYDAALTEGFKALKIIDNSINVQNSISALVEPYEELLGSMMEALASLSSNPTRELSQARDITARMRSLARFVKVRSWKVADVPAKYAELLERNSLIDEAVAYLQDVHNHWQEIYGELNNTISVVRYIQSSQKLPAILKGIGETEKALSYSGRVILFARNFRSKLIAGDTWNSFFASALRNITAVQINLLCSIGRYGEALTLSAAMVLDSRTRCEDRDDEAAKGMIQALFYHSLAQSYNHLSHDSITTATEAISLCSHLWPTNNPSNSAYYLYISLIALCNGLMDAGNVDEALIRLDEAEQAAKTKNKVYSTEELRNANDGSYAAILSQQSRLLFAKGHNLEAADLIKRVESVHRESCKTDKTALTNLARHLHFAGIVYCTLGRYTEGEFAILQLKQLKEDLAATYPGLSRVLQCSLDFMTTRGSWKPVENAKSQLKCGHEHVY
ncbi:hypothetical protein BDN70DRAFT_880725 [Pholiota conissans]|uniref:Fungal N-terminal domain-containing protein n=1 Tax=Pholiota conissans TaxID=109636 RepID=A0A9P6CYT1_9AGAR|nr:hypothetical protein BDN70DRAFT_880725 [Pholiota conissans]